MTEYRFSKHTINLASILIMSLSTFICGQFLISYIFSPVHDLSGIVILLALMATFFLFFRHYFFSGVFTIKKNAFYHKRAFSDKKYPFHRYYVECDKELYYRGYKSPPFYRITILDLETEKEKVIIIFAFTRKYQRADLKMKEEICQFSDHLRKVQS